MKCQELLGALNDYVDGETQSALCRALQEHMADCNPCRVVIDNIRQTIKLYRVDEEIPLPEGLHEQLRAILRQRWEAKFSADRDPHKRSDMPYLFRAMGSPGCRTYIDKNLVEPKGDGQ